MGRLLQEAKTVTPNKGGVRSAIDKLVDRLEGEDRDDLLTLLRDTTFGSTTVARLINEVHGTKIGNDAIIKWRRRNEVA